MIEIFLDGTSVRAHEGSTLTSVLVANGHWHLRRHEVTGVPRGPLCGMGVCLECSVSVDGVDGVRACLTAVGAGMRVLTGGGDGTA